MAKRLVNLAQTFTTYEGEQIKLVRDVKHPEKTEPLTLRDVVLGYCRNSNLLGLSDKDLDEVHVIAMLVGQAEGDVQLTTNQYDVLKRLFDTKGKAKTPNGQEQYLNYNMEVRYQAKDMIDQAPIVDEVKE